MKFTMKSFKILRIFGEESAGCWRDTCCNEDSALEVGTSCFPSCAVFQCRQAVVHVGAISAIQPRKTDHYFDQG